MKCRLSSTNNFIEEKVITSSIVTQRFDRRISNELSAGHTATIEMDEEREYNFLFSNIHMSDDSVIILASENNRSFQLINKNKLTGEGKDKIFTHPIKGKKFTLQVVCRTSSSDTQLLLDSISYNNNITPANLAGDGADNYGRFSSSALKKFDPEAYGLAQPTGIICSSQSNTTGGTGWFLGKSSYLVSCAHVYNKVINNDGEFTGWVRFLIDPTDTSKAVLIGPKGTLVAMGKYRPTPSAKEHNEDYGVVDLDNFDFKYSRISDLVGGLSLNCDDESEHINEIALMPGYPISSNGQQTISYFSANDLSQRCSIPSTIAQQIRTDCYAESGNSGSPIISGKRSTVMGMLWGVASKYPSDPSDMDGENIFRGTKGSHVWESIKDHLGDNKYETTTGLAASYDILPGQLFIDIDSDWTDIESFNSDLLFREFSGTLVHSEGYSFLKVKAKDSIDDTTIDITLRISQRTDEGIFSLEDAHGSKDSCRTLIVCCKSGDNVNVLMKNSIYHMWCGLEGVSASLEAVQNYIITSLDVKRNI